MRSQPLSVVVTRRLPERVEARLSELFGAELRDGDAPLTREARGIGIPEGRIKRLGRGEKPG